METLGDWRGARWSLTPRSFKRDSILKHYTSPQMTLTHPSSRSTIRGCRVRKSWPLPRRRAEETCQRRAQGTTNRGHLVPYNYAQCTDSVSTFTNQELINQKSMHGAESLALHVLTCNQRCPIFVVYRTEHGNGDTGKCTISP